MLYFHDDNAFIGNFQETANRMDQATLNNIILVMVTIVGAVFTAFSVAFVIWTYNDMKARSRDPLAQIAAALVVAVLNVFGLIIYVMLRPRETLVDAYERSLEEEALLQEIEEKPACPGCGRPTQNAWQICPYCHTRLKQPCINCGHFLELSWKLCPVCATVQASGVEPSDEPLRQLGKTPGNPQLRRSPYDTGTAPAQQTPQVQEEQLEWVDSEF
ncbi:MAG: zinc ribbon domain-containing protein [Chloroflexi bacterium]|nr:zinc ribbon domain-containing protein [Chloroflexota bacterium]